VFCSLLFYFRYDHVVYDFIYPEEGDCKWFVDSEKEFRKVWIDPYGPEEAVRISAESYLTKDRAYECGYKTEDLAFAFRGANKNGVELKDDFRITGDNFPEKNPGMSRHYAFLFNTYVFL